MPHINVELLCNPQMVVVRMSSCSFCYCVLEKAKGKGKSKLSTGVQSSVGITRKWVIIALFEIWRKAFIIKKARTKVEWKSHYVGYKHFTPMTYQSSTGYCNFVRRTQIKTGLNHCILISSWLCIPPLFVDWLILAR